VDWNRRWEERTSEVRNAGRRTRQQLAYEPGLPPGKAASPPGPRLGRQDAEAGSGPNFGDSLIVVTAREPGDAILIEKAKDILQSIPTFG